MMDDILAPVHNAQLTAHGPGAAAREAALLSALLECARGTPPTHVHVHTPAPSHLASTCTWPARTPRTLPARARARSTQVLRPAELRRDLTRPRGGGGGRGGRGRNGALGDALEAVGAAGRAPPPFWRLELLEGEALGPAAASPSKNIRPREMEARKAGRGESFCWRLHTSLQKMGGRARVDSMAAAFSSSALARSFDLSMLNFLKTNA